MTLDEYQAEALRTAAAGDPSALATAVAALGLAGEAGEVVDLIKKHLGHGHSLSTETLSAELGDVLWYVAVLADRFGVSLNAVAQGNVAKLRARYPDGFSPERSRNRGRGP